MVLAKERHLLLPLHQNIKQAGTAGGFTSLLVLKKADAMLFCISNKINHGSHRFKGKEICHRNEGMIGNCKCKVTLYSKGT